MARPVPEVDRKYEEFQRLLRKVTEHRDRMLDRIEKALSPNGIIEILKRTKRYYSNLLNQAKRKYPMWYRGAYRTIRESYETLYSHGLEWVKLQYSTEAYWVPEYEPPEYEY